MNVVGLCNAALGVIGDTSVVTSIDPPDGSAAASACAVAWPLARREALALYDWPFARARATLAPLSTTVGNWLFAYQLPSDVLAVRFALPAAGGPFIDHFSRTGTTGDIVGSRYVIEGNTVLSDVELTGIVYTADVLPPYPALFESAVVYLLASYLAGPIIRGPDGIKTASSFREYALSLLSQAAGRLIGQGEQLPGEYFPEMLRVR